MSPSSGSELCRSSGACAPVQILFVKHSSGPYNLLGSDGLAQIGSWHETENPSKIRRGNGFLRLRGNLQDAFHQGRHPLGDLLQVSSVLHRQAETGGYGRTSGTISEKIRPARRPGLGGAVRHQSPLQQFQSPGLNKGAPPRIPCHIEAPGCRGRSYSASFPLVS